MSRRVLRPSGASARDLIGASSPPPRDRTRIRTRSVSTTEAPEEATREAQERVAGLLAGVFGPVMASSRAQPDDADDVPQAPFPALASSPASDSVKTSGSALSAGSNNSDQNPMEKKGSMKSLRRALVATQSVARFRLMPKQENPLAAEIEAELSVASEAEKAGKGDLVVQKAQNDMAKSSAEGGGDDEEPLNTVSPTEGVSSSRTKIKTKNDGSESDSTASGASSPEHVKLSPSSSFEGRLSHEGQESEEAADIRTDVSEDDSRDSSSITDSDDDDDDDDSDDDEIDVVKHVEHNDKIFDAMVIRMQRAQEASAAGSSDNLAETIASMILLAHQKIEEAEEGLEELVGTRDELAMTMTQLRSQIGDFQRVCEDDMKVSRDELEELTTELDKLRELNAPLYARKQALQAECEAMRDTLDQVSAKSKTILEEVSAKRKAEQREANAQVAMVLEELERLAEANEAYTEQCEELENTYLQLRVGREDAELELAEVKKTLADIAPTVEMLDVTRGALQTQVHQLQRKNATLKGVPLDDTDVLNAAAADSPELDTKKLRQIAAQAASAEKIADKAARAAENAAKGMEATGELAATAETAQLSGTKKASTAPDANARSPVVPDGKTTKEPGVAAPRRRNIAANPFPRRKHLTPAHTGSIRCVLAVPFVTRGQLDVSVTADVRDRLLDSEKDPPGLLSRTLSNMHKPAPMYQLWVGCGDGTITVWDSFSSKVIAHRNIPSGSPVYDMCLIHQNSTVIAASKDGNVYMWGTHLSRPTSTETFMPSPASVGPVGTVGAVGFVTRVLEVSTNFDNFVWFGTIDGEIKVYSVSDCSSESRRSASKGKTLLRAVTQYHSNCDIAPELTLTKVLSSKAQTVGCMLRRGHRVWVGTDGKVEIWNSTTMKLAKTLEGHLRTVEGIAQIGALGPQGSDVSEVWTCSSDRTIRCWAGDTHACLAVLECDERVFALRYIPEFGTVWAGTWDPKKLLVFDARLHELRRREKSTHTDAISELMLLGDTLYTASWDRTLCAWTAAKPGESTSRRTHSKKQKKSVLTFGSISKTEGKKVSRKAKIEDGKSTIGRALKRTSLGAFFAGGNKS